MSVEATLVIRGGTVIDGTGTPGFIADVAICGENICAVGPDLKVAGTPKEIDAHGLLVTPGWIDVHTHYDAQATWDPLLTPSAHCGVTTVVMGNCGVGFAPCQKELRPFLLGLMEAVEDIPGTALHEGIQWEWETFPEYLDALARRQYACDVAVMIGHGGVRTWVLGKRANVSDRPGGPEKDPVTPEEVEAIHGVVKEAVAAGALGFSTSRLLLHRDNRGILTPGALAAKTEMKRICDAVAEGGGGVFEMSADFSVYDDIPYDKMDAAKRKEFMKSELGWMAEAMMQHENLQVSFGIGPAMVPFFSKWASKVSKWPGQCNAQFQTRPQSFHLSHASGRTPFAGSSAYKAVKRTAGGNHAKLIELLKGKETREAILADMAQFKPNGKYLIFDTYKNDKGATMPGWMITGDLVYPWTDTYEPLQEAMVSDMAKRTGQSALDIMYDLLLDTEAQHSAVLWRPLFGYNGHNDNIVDSLEFENVIPGFDDAGAHCTVLTDATCATTNICYYGRDRTAGNGRRLPLERLVKVQTGDAALAFGLKDRGMLQPGMRADINIIDLERLTVKAPFWANDLPTNAGRWLQYTEGYRATVLRGVTTFEHDQHTGKLPGRLVRNPKSVGVTEGMAVKAADITHATPEADLTSYAVELSRDGGASAQARVFREELPSKL